MCSPLKFKLSSRDYRVLHLAMHAIVDDTNPMHSKLVFTQKQDSVEDNFLHAYEIYNMNIPAQMTVLSACETGYGKLAKGEGIMSLGRAFAYAGCPSVVMSHWAVNDASTAKLMEYFYKYLSYGEAKDRALQLAKLEFFRKSGSCTSKSILLGEFCCDGKCGSSDFKYSILERVQNCNICDYYNVANIINLYRLQTV